MVILKKLFDFSAPEGTTWAGTPPFAIYLFFLLVLCLVTYIVLSHLSVPITYVLYLEYLTILILDVLALVGIVKLFAKFKFPPTIATVLGLIIMAGFFFLCLFWLSKFARDSFGFKREIMETSLTRNWIGAPEDIGVAYLTCQARVETKTNNKTYYYGCADPNTKILTEDRLKNQEPDDSIYRLTVLPNTLHIIKAEKVST